MGDRGVVWKKREEIKEGNRRREAGGEGQGSNKKEGEGTTISDDEHC